MTGLELILLVMGVQAAGALLMYVALAGGSWLWFFRLRRERYLPGEPPDDPAEIRRAVIQTLWNIAGAAVLGAPIFVAAFSGPGKVYFSIAERGWGYYFLSILAVLAITETGVYWIHRGLHRPLAYKWLHRGHHQFLSPTPWVSLAFHPLDGFAQAFPLHACAFLFPLHASVYLGFLVFSMLWTIMIHDRQSFVRIGLILYTGHHTIHHGMNRFNYGQYLTLWDRIGGTYRSPEPAAGGAGPRMKQCVGLAWRNLTHTRARTLVALSGLAFAILLMFMQLGLYGAVLSTATLIYGEMDFDIVLVSPEHVNFSKTGTVSRARLAQAAAVPSVARVAAFHTGVVPWRNDATGRRTKILVMAWDVDVPVFRRDDLSPAACQVLRRPDTVIIDRRTRPEFGPQEAGTRVEAEDRTVEVVGQYVMGTGFVSYGAVVASDRTFARIFKRPLDRMSVGLVSIERGASADAVAAELRALVGDDVRVLTRAELAEHETEFWVEQTFVGIIFGLGAALAFVVGAVIFYQLLATDVANHLPEFATLKAMGYRDVDLTAVVLSSAGMLAALSFVPAFLVSLAMYSEIRRTAFLPVHMNPGRAAFVFALTLVMCGAASLIALRKAKTADPADLF